jgi:vitamin B12 transporter
VFNNFAIDGRSTQWSSQSDFSVGGGNLLTFGLQYEDRDTDNRGTFDGSTRLRSAFLQDQWSWRDRTFLTASVRHDDHSQFGGETTYRATAAHQVGDGGPRLRASFGTGFRAPNLNELLFPGFGNPALKPERSRGFDVGIEQELLARRLRWSATYFETAYRDLIAFDLTTFLANNIAEADVDGLELSLGYVPVPTLELQLSHTYLDTENLTTGRPLARRPRHRSTLSAFFDLGPRVDGTLAVISVRDRIDSDGAPMDDYVRVDLGFEYPWSDRFKVFLRAVNLFDEDYEEVPGFTTPGLVASAGLRARF